MKKSFAVISLVGSAILLAGCNSGITYGTGSSHEVQTMKGLSNIFALKADDEKKIDYTARPDLIMPANQQALPAPEISTSDADPNWPVSPEQRIASIRAGAPEVGKEGTLPTEYLTDTNKLGIRNSRGINPVKRTSRIGDESQFVNAIRDDANGQGEGIEARKLREELSYGNGVQRKFLTEPPTLYRTPSANAEAGDTGQTVEQLTKAQKKAAEQKKASDNGYIIPGS